MDQMKTFITDLASLQHSAAAAQEAQAAADPRGVDPFTVHGDGWQRGRSPVAAEQIYLGTPVGREGPPGFGRAPHQRWALYDDKYVISG